MAHPLDPGTTVNCTCTGTPVMAWAGKNKYHDIWVCPICNRKKYTLLAGSW